jgi:ribosomal protein S6
MSEEHEDKGISRSVYELGYHLVPSLGEEDLALRVEEIQQVVAKSGGEMISEGSPELIDLAYTVVKKSAGANQRFTSAYFGWMKFEILPEAVLGVEEMCKSNQYILRHLLVHSDRQQNVPLVKIKPQVSDEVIVHRPDVSSDTGEVSDEELEKAVEEMVGEDTTNTKGVISS